MSPVSRRAFLGTSIRLGAGAAALGLTGADLLAGELPAEAAPSSGLDPSFRPAEPPLVQRFVSRPDLTPPGVTIRRVADLATRGGQPQYIFATPRATPGTNQPAASQGLMIMDLDGQLVWFRSMPGTTNLPFNFRVQTYRGVPRLTWFQGKLLVGWGSGEDVISDAAYRSVRTVRAVRGLDADLHEFLITPSGTALITSFEVQPSQHVVSGHVQEIDIASRELVWSWSSYPAVPVSESVSNVDGDYFHINSVAEWPNADRDILISARNTSAVYLISRRTGRILWRLGGTRSDFSIGTGSEFSYQHDARPLADGSGISVFDDASSRTPETTSSGKVINLYQSSPLHTTLRHQYPHVGVPIDAASQGNCQLLATGGHFVGWGQVPYFTEFAPSGGAVRADTLLDGRFPTNIENYRAFMYDWVGDPPVGEIALVVRRSSGTGNFEAYASWNGATEVRSWELSAGPSSSALAQVGGAGRTGFETRIAVTRAGATDFQVAALDADGRVLGRSTVVGVS